MAPYNKAGDDLLTDLQKVKLGWMGNHEDFERTPSVVNRGEHLGSQRDLGDDYGTSTNRVGEAPDAEGL